MCSHENCHVPSQLGYSSFRLTSEEKDISNKEKDVLKRRIEQKFEQFIKDNNLVLVSFSLKQVYCTGDITYYANIDKKELYKFVSDNSYNNCIVKMDDSCIRKTNYLKSTLGTCYCKVIDDSN